jgi:hypothetical protein
LLELPTRPPESVCAVVAEAAEPEALPAAHVQEAVHESPEHESRGPIVAREMEKLAIDGACTMEKVAVRRAVLSLVNEADAGGRKNYVKVVADSPVSGRRRSPMETPKSRRRMLPERSRKGVEKAGGHGEDLAKPAGVRKGKVA